MHILLTLCCFVTPDFVPVGKEGHFDINDRYSLYLVSVYWYLCNGRMQAYNSRLYSLEHKSDHPQLGFQSVMHLLPVPSDCRRIYRWRYVAKASERMMQTATFYIINEESPQATVAGFEEYIASSTFISCRGSMRSPPNERF